MPSKHPVPLLLFNHVCINNVHHNTYIHTQHMASHNAYTYSWYTSRHIHLHLVHNTTQYIHLYPMHNMIQHIHWVQHNKYMSWYHDYTLHIHSVVCLQHNIYDMQTIPHVHQYHMYNIYIVPTVHRTTCTLHHLHNMCTASHVHDTTCRTST